MNFKIPILPSREECSYITKNTDAFFVSETVIEGQKVEIYNYRLTSLSDFEQETIRLEENNKTLLFYHTELINGKMIGEMTNIEIEELGFSFFESIKLS